MTSFADQFIPREKPDSCFAHERKARFANLPEGLRDQYYHSPVVHMWVSAFLYDRIDREEMLAGLAGALATQEAETRKQLIRFVEWFGAPPVVRP